MCGYLGYAVTYSYAVAVRHWSRGIPRFRFSTSIIIVIVVHYQSLLHHIILHCCQSLSTKTCSYHWVRLAKLHGYNYDSTAIRPPFDCNLTALQPFNDLCYDQAQAAALSPKK